MNVPSRRRVAIPAACLLSSLLLLALAAPAGAKSKGVTEGVANEDLAKAAQAAPVKAIDYDNDRCDDRTVGQWLSDLTGKEARSVAWTGGPCQLTGPGIDGGSSWCAQAVIVPAHPRDHEDRPMVEIFFEAPVQGEPGKPYAFRGAMLTPDGRDLTRFRWDFEADWAASFPTAPNAVVDCGGQ